MSIDARAIPDMIQWYEGMLLMPEHFQSANRRQEMLGGYLAQACAAYPWGVRSLEVELRDGVLTVRRIEAVLPDGLIVHHRHDARESVPLEINLKRHAPAPVPQQKLAVHLIVPAWSDQLIAQEGAEAGALARYHSVRGARLGRDDPDPALHTPAMDRVHERPWLRPILRLYVTEGPLAPPPGKYVSLPLARLYVDAASEYRLDRYEPPRITAAGAEEIRRCVGDVAGELRAKAQLLDDRLRRENALPSRGESDGVTSSEMLIRLLTRRFAALKQNVENLQSLVRTVPRLEALARDACTHPFPLYLALCDVVGDMAVLGGELNLPDLPVYRHEDALAAFDLLKAHITSAAQSLGQRYTAHMFERVTPGRFELAIDVAALPTKFVIGAMRSHGAPASPIREWVSRAKIVTEDQRRDAKRHRTAGAARHAIERDDSLDLAAPALTCLFRVEASADTIDADGTLLVVENNSGEPPSAVLLYLPREIDPLPNGDAGHHPAITPTPVPGADAAAP